MEREEVGKRSFSRKDEGPTPWLFDSLSSPATDSSTTIQGFYPLAQLATHNRLFKLPKPIHFPPTMLLSNNYFKTGWSFNTYRRIKNVIVTMDWIPDVGVQALRLREMHDMKYQPVLTDKQQELTAIAFKLFNLRGDGKLSSDEFRSLLSALDVYLTSEADLLEYMSLIDWGKDGLDLEDIKRMMRFQQYMKMQQGRYQVALTLHEAETIRGIMHMHTGGPLLPLTPTAIALRVNASGAVMDSSQSWYPAGEYQSTLEQSCYRFVDSDMHFKEREVHMLLRALQPNLVEDREVWWSEIRACRLRQITDWKVSPLHLVFTVQDEYHLLQMRAYIARIRGILKQRKMGLLDAYRLFDCDRNGVLSYEEMYGGVTWLGLGDQCTGQQVQEMCLAMDHDKDGAILYVDFVRHLRDLNEEIEIEEQQEEQKNKQQQQNQDLTWLGLDLMSGSSSSSGLGFGSSAAQTSTQDNSAWMELIAGSTGTEHHAAWKEQYGDIRPRVLFPEKALLTAGNAESASRDLKARILKAAEKLRIDVARVSGYTSVWDSKGSMSRTKVSVWAGHVLKNKNYRTSVCLGHYSTAGFSKPDDKNFYLTITDSSSVLGWFKSKSCYLILNALCPHPIKFKQVWMSRGGDKPLYAWEATPPSKEFVALSHVFTTTPDEPALSELRCVPRVWCVPASVAPRCVWDDSGGGGRRGSIWVVNSLGSVCVVEGHEKPTGKDFFDLVSNKFMATLNLEKMAWGDSKGSSSSGGAGGIMDSKWKASLDSWMDQWEMDEMEQEKEQAPPVANPFEPKDQSPTTVAGSVATSARAQHVATHYASYALSHNTSHTAEEKDLFVKHHAELHALIREEESRAAQAVQSHVEMRPGDVNRPTVPSVPAFSHPTANTSYTGDWLPRSNQLTPDITAKFQTLATPPKLVHTYVPPVTVPLRQAPTLPEIAAPVSSIGGGSVGAGSYGANSVANVGGFGSYGANSAASGGAAAAGSSYAAPAAFVPPAQPTPVQPAYVPSASSSSSASSFSAAPSRHASVKAPSPSTSTSSAADAAAFAGMSLGAAAAPSSSKPPAAARKPTAGATPTAASAAAAVKPAASAEDMFALMNVKAAAPSPSPPNAATPPTKSPMIQPTKAPSPLAKPTVAAAAPSVMSPLSAGSSQPQPPQLATQPQAGLSLLPGLDFSAPPSKTPSSSSASSSSALSPSSGFKPLDAGSMLLGDAPLAGLGPMTLSGPGGLSKMPPPSAKLPFSSSSSSSSSSSAMASNDLDIFSGMQTRSSSSVSSKAPTAAAAATSDLDIFGLAPAKVRAACSTLLCV